MSPGPDGALAKAVEAALGDRVVRTTSLGGGSVAAVNLVTLADGTDVVAKQAGRSEGRLMLEGEMLRYLAANSDLPVPGVLYGNDHLLILVYVPGASRFTAESQRHAAELMAQLHGIASEDFGFEYDTLIGGLHQPNPPTASWLRFFREQRLIHMGRLALDEGRLPGQVYGKLEKFVGDLDRWLEEPARPSLIHGDAWTGNIMAMDGRITAFLDPAIYFADPEIELAFTTLFGTFGDSFFERYHEIRPIQPGFMAERRHIYNLYPLLVHVRLFGGGYVSSVSQTLARFGY